MLPRLSALLGLALGAGVCGAQTPARFDTPTVALGFRYHLPWGDGGRFTNVGDFDGDGHVDMIGEWAYLYGDVQRKLKVWYGDGAGGISHSFLREYTHSRSFTQIDYELPDGLVAVGQLGPPDAADDFVYAYDEYSGGAWRVRVRVFGPAHRNMLLAAGDAVKDVQLGDFDGDGEGDFALLVTRNDGTSVVRFHLCRSLDWETTVRELGLSSGNWDQLDRGRLNGDDVDDVLCAGDSAIAVRGLVPNTRKTRKVVPPFVPAGRTPQFTLEHGLGTVESAVGDLDGDGDDDAVLFTLAGYRLLRQTSPGILELEPIASGGPAAELADVDGDGDLDGICCGGGGGPAFANYNPLGMSKFEIAINDGTGGFAPSFSLPGLASEKIAGAADLDEDGDLDLVAGRVILFNRGAIAPSLAVPAVIALLPSAILDIEGDGDPDLELSLGRCVLNQGDGTFVTETPPMPAPPPGETFLGPGLPGDVDGDGCADLLVESWDGAQFEGLHLLLNDGGGSFTDAGVVATPATPFSERTAFNAAACRILDLDGDGDGDLVLTGVPSATTTFPRFTAVWMNQGAAGLVQTVEYGNARLRVIGDFDADGELDLVIQTAQRYYWHRGLGAGSFEARDLIHGSSFGFEIGDKPAAIFDELESRDVVMAIRPGSGSYEYVWNGAGWVELYCPLEPHGWASTSPAIATTYIEGDLDDDGDEDLMVWPIWGLGAGTSLGGPAGFGTAESIQLLEPVAFADVDGDGDLDAIEANRIVRNLTYDGPAAGSRVQYGAGSAGTGGVVPTLGAVGPFRVGEKVEFRIRGGCGGAMATLVISRTPAAIGDWPVAGVTGWVDPSDAHYRRIAVPLDGVPGAAGTGSGVVHFEVPPGHAGVTSYLQVWVSDLGAPGGIATSQGLAIEFGG